MPASKARDTVLVIGSSGSLGVPIVAELLRRAHSKIRLLGRSKESFARAGYIDTIDGSSASVQYASIDFAIIRDVTDPTSFLNCLFTDVSCVICVARPRSLKEGDAMSYRPMVKNLCSAALRAEVPRILLHGLPYLEDNSVAGDSPTMMTVRETEIMAREIFDQSPDKSSLTISRICEMSEIGHLLEAAKMIGFFPCAIGCNPLLHPISPQDFAIAVANYVEDETFTEKELLVGGPRQITWRELGKITTKASKGRLRTYVFPLFVYRVILHVLQLFPSLKGLYICFKLIVIPMTTNTASDDFLSVGSDSILEEYIKNELEAGGTSWVHSKVFKGKRQGVGDQIASVLPSTTSLACLVGCLASCDAVVAFLNPSFIGNMQNLDVSVDTLHRRLVQAFGAASFSIAVVTLLSVNKFSKTGEQTKTRARHAEGWSYPALPFWRPLYISYAQI